MCQEAGSEVISMEHMGVIFNRDEEGRLGTRAFGGQRQARTFFVSDFTGQALLHVLYEQVMKAGVRIYEEWFLLSLIVEDGECAGRSHHGDSQRRNPCGSLQDGHNGVRRARACLRAEHQRSYLHRRRHVGCVPGWRIAYGHWRWCSTIRQRSKEVACSSLKEHGARAHTCSTRRARDSWRGMHQT